MLQLHSYKGKWEKEKKKSKLEWWRLSEATSFANDERKTRAPARRREDGRVVESEVPFHREFLELKQWIQVAPQRKIGGRRFRRRWSRCTILFPRKESLRDAKSLSWPRFSFPLLLKVSIPKLIPLFSLLHWSFCFRIIRNLVFSRGFDPNAQWKVL